MKHETDLIYDFILENELTTTDALDLALACSGTNLETLNYIIYYFTGYHDIEQLHDCEASNYYFNDDIIKFYGLDKAV